jgi:hypothetical protein
VAVRPAADAWVAARLRDAAADAVGRGAPQAAAALLGRALAEPPPASERVALLLELGRAEELAGQDAALAHLAEARELTADRRRRAEIELQMARAQADLFHRVEDAPSGRGRTVVPHGQVRDPRRSAGAAATITPPQSAQELAA